LRVRESKFDTDDTCHRDPRAERRPRSLSPRVSASRVLAPELCSASTMGIRPAAKASALAASACRPNEPAAVRFVGLPRLAPPLLLRQGGVEVWHERVRIPAQLRHDEGHAAPSGRTRTLHRGTACRAWRQAGASRPQESRRHYPYPSLLVSEFKLLGQMVPRISRGD
jgi:hypothetical protein